MFTFPVAHFGGELSYEIDQSIRFNDGDSPYLNRSFVTPTSAANFGYSFWVKLGAGYNGSYILSANGSGNNDNFYFSSNKINIQEGGVNRLISDQVFRDHAAWYHFVVAYELGNSTNAEKLRVYLNGSEITSWSTDARSGLSSTSSRLNANGVSHDIGANVNNGVSTHLNNFDGYLAEFHFVDGTVLTPAMFGETDSDGVWVPIEASPSYGNNGFYLDFQDSSDLGEDFSGNNNDFTSSGLTADQMLDTPTLNASTLNPLWAGAGLSDGNLVATATGNSYQWATSTFAIDDGGKYVCEFQKSAGTFGYVGIFQLGNHNVKTGNNYMYAINVGTGEVVKNASVLVDVGAAPANSLMRIEYDGSNDTIKIFDDGAETFPAATGVSNTVGLTGQNSLHFGCAPYGSGTVITATFQNLSGTPTADFLELTSTALPTPSITDGSKYFQPTLFTGTGSTQTITNGGNSDLQPDLIWIKNRSATDSHVLTDSVRGATKILATNSTGAESTDADTVTAFNSDGFALGADVKVNTSSENYVAWQWKADSAWSESASGNILASSGRRNTTAGFSIASWTHRTSANYAIKHGLSTTPEFFMIKSRDSGTNWDCWHKDLGDTAKRLIMTTSAEITAYWVDASDSDDGSGSYGDISSGESPVTASLFGFQHDNFSATDDIIGYFFHGVVGHSSFGSYTGNGSTGTGGVFVHTGFTPAMVILKRTNSAQEWQIYDNQRSPTNVMSKLLKPNDSAAEVDNSPGDNEISFLSNGFQLNEDNGGMNASGSSYIFAAWAELPFGGDGVAPATAR